MFNRADILTKAWASYRRDVQQGLGVRRDGPFSREHFAYCLRQSWAIARECTVAPHSALTAPVVADAVNLLGAVQVKRLADIDDELRAQDFSDAPTNWGHRRDLQAERSELLTHAA